MAQPQGMKPKGWIERYDAHGVVQTVGPLEYFEMDKAWNHQMAIAEAHNRARPPGSSGGGGRQYVRWVERA